MGAVRLLFAGFLQQGRKYVNPVLLNRFNADAAAVSNSLHFYCICQRALVGGIHSLPSVTVAMIRTTTGRSRYRIFVMCTRQQKVRRGVR